MVALHQLIPHPSIRAHAILIAMSCHHTDVPSAEYISTPLNIAGSADDRVRISCAEIPDGHFIANLASPKVSASASDPAALNPGVGANWAPAAPASPDAHQNVPRDEL